MSNFSGGEQSEPYAADLKTIGDRLAHARQFEAPLITEEQLVALVVILLDQHGAVPIGKNSVNINKHFRLESKMVSVGFFFQEKWEACFTMQRITIHYLQ